MFDMHRFLHQTQRGVLFGWVCMAPTRCCSKARWRLEAGRVLGCGQRMQVPVRLPNASEARQIARRNLRNTWVIPGWRGGRQSALSPLLR
jgi:hypothetical protein